jgi:hypothetical protein
VVGNRSSIGFILSEGKVLGLLDGCALRSKLGATLGSLVGTALGARLGTTLG